MKLQQGQRVKIIFQRSEHLSMRKPKTDLLPQESIESKIFSIRGKRVMFDRDLANLYQVETKVLN